MLKLSLRSSGLRFLWLTLLVFCLDWISKTLADHYLALYDPLALFPSFNLTLAYNTGAAFSFLSNGSYWPNIFFAVVALTVSLGLLVWLSRLPRTEVLLPVGLALILGGALGNLWDRLAHQHVIDFMDFYISQWHWPVFNVADVAVSLGAFLIIWKWLVLNNERG